MSRQFLLQALFSSCGIWSVQFAGAVDRRQVMRMEDSTGAIQHQGRLEAEEEHSLMSIGSNGNMKTQKQKQLPDAAMSQLAESSVPYYQVAPGTAQMMPAAGMPVMVPAPSSPQQQIGGMPAGYSMPQGQPMGAAVPMIPAFGGQPMKVPTPMYQPPQQVPVPQAPVPMYQAPQQAPVYQPVPQIPAMQAPVYQSVPQIPAMQAAPQAPTYQMAPLTPAYQAVPQPPVYQTMPQAPVYQAAPQAPQAPIYQVAPQQEPVYQAPPPRVVEVPGYQVAPMVKAQQPITARGEVAAPPVAVVPTPVPAPATIAQETTSKAPTPAPAVVATTTAKPSSPLGIAPVPSAAKEVIKDAQDESETPAKRRVIIMVLVASVNIVLAVYFLRKNCDISATKSIGNLGLMFSKYRMPTPPNVPVAKASAGGDRAPRAEAPKASPPMREASDDDISSRSQSSEEDTDIRH